MSNDCLRYFDQLVHYCPSPESLASLLQNPNVNTQQIVQALTSAILVSASNGDSDVLEWIFVSSPTLLPVDVKPPSPNVTDDDGFTALILATCFSHGDAVRVLIESGAFINETDSSGWTALHWAAQNSDFPLASYLLNHGADPGKQSFKSLSPLDLVKRGPKGDIVRETIRCALESREKSLNLPDSVSTCSIESIKKTNEREETQKKRNSAILESASMLQLNPAIFEFLQNTQSQTSHKDNQEWSDAAAIGYVNCCHCCCSDNDTDSVSDIVSRTLSPDMSPIPSLPTSSESSPQPRPKSKNNIPRVSRTNASSSTNFRWDHCLPHQMLIFDDYRMSSILHTIFESSSSTTPLPLPRQRRFLQSNIIFLLSRFAVYHCTNELLDNFLTNCFEQIELKIRKNSHDMAQLSYWLANCLQLIYYFKKDARLCLLTDYHIAVEDLCNEVFVYIVREIEKRVDNLLEPCLLDHEAVPGFEDVQFEDEWRFMKVLTGRSRKDSNNWRRVSFFSNNTPPPSADGVSSANVPSQVFLKSPPASPKKAVPFLSRKGNSLANLRETQTNTHQRRQSATARLGIAFPPTEPILKSWSSTAAFAESPKESPRQVTDLLSALLLVLETFEIHPAVVVQIMSQIQYWIASEMFNRILSKRKYLCRSKAIQIRLNVSSLEDWCRINRLPPKMTKTHFKMVDQLLQWLLCLSSETTLDGLIGTLQNLKVLNPLQLHRAAKDYRYEVDEQKMSDECKEYLLMTTFDWERRYDKNDDKKRREDRVRAAAILASSGAPVIPGQEYYYVKDDVDEAEMIDWGEERRQEDEDEKRRVAAEEYLDEIIFKSIRLENYDPAMLLSENQHVMVNSRYMLPFVLPTRKDDMITHMRRDRDVFGPFATHGGVPVDRSGACTPVGSGAGFNTNCGKMTKNNDHDVNSVEVESVSSKVESSSSTGFCGNCNGGSCENCKEEWIAPVIPMKYVKALYEQVGNTVENHRRQEKSGLIKEMNVELSHDGNISNGNISGDLKASVSVGNIELAGRRLEEWANWRTLLDREAIYD